MTTPGLDRIAAAAQMQEYRKRVYLNRGPLKRPALGVTRRLRALHALGWTGADLAAQLGVHKSRVERLMHGQQDKVFPATADAICALYDKLSMTVPADSADPRSKVHVHQRARNRARRLSYAPPLAWDNIDDPDETPCLGTSTSARPADDVDESVITRALAGERIHTTLAERRLIMAHWLAGGRSEKALCERMGWRSGRYLPQELEEAG